MPWTSWMLGISSLMMPPQNHVDMVHKWNVLLSIGAIIGSCVVSYTAVRERRQERAKRLAKLIADGIPVEELLAEGFTTSELRGYGVWPCSPEPKKLNRGTCNVELYRKQLQNQRGRQGDSSSPSSGVPLFPSSGTCDQVWTKNSSNGATSGEIPSLCDSEFHTVVGNMTLSVANSFTMEDAFYRFPLELKRYAHHDGSSLTLVAEDLAATRENITTELYKMKCIERVRAVAEQQHTYFKVRCDAPANTVVTTIMERFVNISTGYASMVAAVFFLVQDHMGYIIQLQTHVDVYEARLADLCRTLQSATIGHIPRQPSGQQEHALQSGARGEMFLVSLPLRFTVTRTTIGSTLALRHRHTDGWSGEILTWTPKLKREESDDGVYVLIPDKLYLVSRWHSDGTTPANIVEEVKLLLSGVSATLVGKGSRDLPPSRYISNTLAIPLPPIDVFTTCVCNHAADPYINLFIDTKDEEKFELEVGSLPLTEVSDLTLLVNPLFLKPPRQQVTSVEGGMTAVVFVGETKNSMTLNISALGLTYANIWFLVKCIHNSKNEMPNVLRRYIEFVLDEFSFSVIS